MLTQEQKIYGQRVAMYHTLFYDFQLRKRNYKELQVLYDQAVLGNNKMLIELLDEYRIIGATPSGSVFSDIILVIFRCSETNPAILDTFEMLYSKKYPDCVEWIKACENRYLSGEHELFDEAPGKAISKLSTKSPWNTDKKYYEFSVFMKYGFKQFLAYRLETFDAEKVLNMNYILDIALLSSHLKPDSIASLQKEPFQVLLTVDNENLYETKQYKKWAAEQTHLLISYLREILDPKPVPLSEKNYSSILNWFFCFWCSQYVHKDKPDDPDAPEGYNGSKISIHAPWRVSQVAQAVLQKRVGSNDWYNKVVPDLDDDAYYNYHASFDCIKAVDLYLRSHVMEKARTKYSASKEQMTRRDIARMEPIPPEVIFENLAVQYQYFVFSELLYRTTKSYYETFSFERLVDSDLIKRYEEIISSLQNDVCTLSHQLSDLKTSYSDLQSSISGQINKAALQHNRDAVSLLRESEKKDKEIESLKERIKSQEEFIALLSQPIPDVDEPTADLSFIKSKRYLFVGRVDQIMFGLRKEFPDSVFMDSETTRIDNIKADAIVFLIQGMSHSMFYKVNSEPSLSELPRIYMNYRNLNILYNEMKKIISTPQ